MIEKEGTRSFRQDTLGIRRADIGGGKMGGPYAAGPSGICKCPKCNTEFPHEVGVPCTSNICPNCGEIMVRE